MVHTSLLFSFFINVKSWHAIDTGADSFHVDPYLLPQVQVDSGAIRFILGGADVMCPGLTSVGGRLPDNLLAGSVVV
jgi:predicted RNA-binding protein (TIGR00451 family)